MTWIDRLQQNNWILLAVGSGLITVWLLSRLAKRRRQPLPDPKLMRDEQIERNRRLRGTQGQLEDVMVEIEQMAKRLSNHLDAKTIAIEKLITEADGKIHQLQDLVEKTAAASTTPNHATPDHPLAHPHQAPKTHTSPVAPVPSLVQNMDEPLVPPELTSPISTTDAMAQSIYVLADQGMDPIAIARELDEHVGKVELILALRRP